MCIYTYIDRYIIMSLRVIMPSQEPAYLRNTAVPGKEKYQSSSWLEGSKRPQKQPKLTPLSFLAPNNLKVRIYAEDIT